MAQFPSLPLFTDAYLADTTHLSTTEHGAYLLLLIVAWRSPDCGLPSNPRELQKYSRLTPGQFNRIWPVLKDFFYEDNGRLFQGRLLDELETVKRLTIQRSNAGKASALKRKKRDERALVRDANEKQAPTPTPTPTPTTKPYSPFVNEAVEIYNEVAEKISIPLCQKVTDTRRKQIEARLNDCEGIEGWKAAMVKLEQSPHCHGFNDRGWKASIDFLCRESSFVKLMEGVYDGAPMQQDISKADIFDAMRKQVK